MDVCYICQFVLAAYFVASSRVLAKKPVELTHLAFVAITGKEPSDGRVCITAMQVVTDVVNSRPDILPEHHITIHVEDEGKSAATAPKNFLKFIRNITTEKLAPVVFGPSTQCNAAAVITRQYRLTEFTQSCGGPLTVGNRKLLANLYRLQMPSNNYNIGILKMMQNVGKWQQFGIVTSSDVPNEYEVARSLLDMSTGLGLDVVVFESGTTATPEMLATLKDSKARVFAVITSQIPLCFKFLCLAYKAGMTAPRYIIILLFYCYVAVDSPALVLPDGCTRAMIYEQMKITFFVGSYQSAVFPNGNTSLGYDQAYFDAEVDRRLNNVKYVDYDQRHICHDTMLASLWTMHKADQNLRSTYNKSLSDFENDPFLVSNAVNKSAATLDFVGLRTGRIAYSERLEIDDEPVWITQWLNGTLRMLYKVVRINGSRTMYDVVGLTQPVWFTATGLPPKDLSHVDIRRIVFPDSIRLAVFTISGLALLLHLLSGVVLISGKLKRAPCYFDAVSTFAILAGSFLIDISAILLVFDVAQETGGLSLCNSQLCSTIIGISMLNAAITTRIVNFVKNVTNTQNNARNESRVSARNGRKPATGVIGTSPKIQIPRQSSTTSSAGLISAILAVTGLVLAVALAKFDKTSILSSFTPVTFDETLDAYYTYQDVYCTSEYQLYWIGALVGGHLLLLLMDCYLSYTIRHVRVVASYRHEFSIVRLASVNAAMIHFAILLIMVAMSSSGNSIARTAVFSFGLIIYSLTSSTIFTYPMIAALLKTDQQAEAAMNLSVAHLSGKGSESAKVR